METALAVRQLSVSYGGIDAISDIRDRKSVV